MTCQAGSHNLSSMIPAQTQDSIEPQPVIRLRGHDLLPLAEGALWWAAQSTLIVSDLHLEKGASYARGGQFLPPYDSTATLARVERLVREKRPRQVISLGDSFHRRDSAARLSGDMVARIRALTAQVDWHWVEGNHDPDPPEHLGGTPCKTLHLGRLVFRHEPSGEKGEVAGHLHPVARLAGRGKRLRRRCFVSDGNALILPAMGAFTGGLNVTEQPFADVLSPNRQVFLLGQTRTYQVPASRLVPDRAQKPVWRFQG